MTKLSRSVRRLACAAVCLALALVLPFVTGNIPQIGSALCPMHLPVLLCGFLCGWPWGLAVGFLAPLLRSVLFGMPPMYPSALGMAFELAGYGVITGLLSRLLPKKLGYTYLTLAAAMLGGRLIWGAARFVMAGLGGSDFPFFISILGAVTGAVPGLIAQLVLVPVLVTALRKAKVTPDD